MKQLSLYSNYLIPSSLLLTTTLYPLNIISRFICTFLECISWMCTSWITFIINIFIPHLMCIIHYARFCWEIHRNKSHGTCSRASTILLWVQCINMYKVWVNKRLTHPYKLIGQELSRSSTEIIVKLVLWFRIMTCYCGIKSPGIFNKCLWDRE